MAKTEPTVLRIGSPSDIVTTVPRMLGFRPRDSIVIICASGERQRFGLVLRFDLEATWDPGAFARCVEERVRHERAESFFLIVYADDEEPFDEHDLPYTDVIDEVTARLRDLDDASWLVVGDSYWNYCPDSRCCPRGPQPVDHETPGATATAAAYALLGRGLLADREALVASMAYDGTVDDEAAFDELLAAKRSQLSEVSQGIRQQDAKALAVSLSAAVKDPHYVVTDEDAAAVVALCDDVLVRDEFMVRALKPRRRDALQQLMTAVVRRVPPPHDVAVCATLAWIAYANGQGAIANIALERALVTDPYYSLANLIADSLDRQIDPHHLREVMRGAARDLKVSRGAG